MKKVFLFVAIALMSASTLSASNTRTGGIWYDFDEATLTATVTYRGDEPRSFDDEYTNRVIIPEKVTYVSPSGQSNVYTVTAIGDYAFFYCKTLKEVKLPNSIVSIGERAFSVCHRLISINIPESVVEIKSYAFNCCFSLLNLEVPTTVTAIQSDAFRRVGNIIYSGSNVEAPWEARSMNGYVDGYLVYKDETKTELLACSYLATSPLDIPETVTTIGEHAFQYCINLDSLKLPESVKTIETYAFSFCTNMISLEVPSTVSTIGDYGFNQVPNVIYKGSLGQRGAKTMNGYVEGNYVYEDDTKTVLSAVAQKVSGHVNVPNTVKTIDNSAFFVDADSKIKSVTVGNSVEKIDKWGVLRCKRLESIELPKSLKTIGEKAFDECSALTTFVCKATTPPMIEGSFKIFESFEFEGKIYVPSESVETYKSAAKWSDYKDQIYAITAESIAIVSETEIFVKAGDYYASVSWPIIEDVVLVQITIKQEDDIVTSCAFDENGAYVPTASMAPSKDGLHSAPTSATAVYKGWKYTVEGLEPKTKYTAEVVFKNSADEIVHQRSKNFTTLLPQSINQISDSKGIDKKQIKDGRLVIMHNGKTYTVTGQVED